MRRLVPALLLLAYGGAFAVAAFGRGLPAFDDHPGQFFRLWHALERSFPGGRWTADWNPDWWGGYPELQFYPPGLALMGAAIRLIGLWQPSVELVYQLLCGLILLLPALTTFALLRAVLDDDWLALPPAILALTLSAGLRGGIEESLRWGMLTTRLSVGLLPLLALSLRSWIEGRRPPIWAAPAAAAVVLAHPANAPAAATLVLVAALLSAILRPGRRTAAEAGVVAGLAIALTAFWAFPLALRRAWLVPLAWSHPETPGAIGQPVLALLAVAALVAWLPVFLRRRPFDAFLAVLPIALVGVGAANAGLFARGLSVIEPARLADGTVAAALWAGGLGVGALVARLTARGPRSAMRPVVALALVALLAVLPTTAHGEPGLTLWPRPGQWPRWQEVSRTHDLPRLWNALRGRPDRVLFTTSALRLGPERTWFAPHSHAFSLTPLHAGREVVHGTFTHPAPLAARFYTGDRTPPPRLDALVEQLDGERLLGQPWERLTSEAFDAFARRLRVSTVVVPTPLVKRARFLGDRYVASAEAAGHTVFERRDRPWPEVERITHRRYRVLVPPTGGVWIPTGIPAYPLWRAKGGQGPLETRVDPWGLLEFRVPIDVFEAELVYAEGPVEWVSLAVTVLGGFGWLAWAWRARHGTRVTARAPGSSRSGRGPRRR